MTKPLSSAGFSADQPAAVPSLSHKEWTVTGMPGLFDWFVGGVSILLGFSMFLYSRHLDEFAIVPHLAWFGALRLTFIVGGIGLIVADIAGRKERFWQRLFHVFLVVAYSFLAAIMWRIADWDAAITYGAISLVVLLFLIINLEPVAMIMILTQALMAGYLWVSLWEPLDPHLLQLGNSLAADVPLVRVVWYVAVALYTILAWWGYFRFRRLFWVTMGVTGVGLLALALFYATQIYWGRAVVLLVLAVAVLFIPSWDSLHSSRMLDRRRIFTAFGAVLALFLTTIGIERLAQSALIELAGKELTHKLNHGKQLIETTLATSQLTIESLANNPVIQQALVEKDQELATSLTRIAFEVGLFRRVLILDKAGDILAYYPRDNSVTVTNVAFRDYFIQATTHKKTYISDLFEAKTATSVMTVAIAAPVLVKKEVAGVVVGSINLVSLGAKLQETTRDETGEHFSVADRDQRRIIHPEPSLIGTNLEEGNLLRRAVAGEKGIDEAYGARGTRMLTVYDHVEKLGWGVIVAQPMSTVVQSRYLSWLVVGAQVLGSILLAIWFFGACHYWRLWFSPKAKDSS